MSLAPVLLIGGSGIVGRNTARYFREANPDVPLLIGGRDLVKAQKIASEIGNAQGVVLDLSAADLGLGEQSVSAVAALIKDEALAGLRFAQAQKVPHVSIASSSSEIGPEVAAYIHNPAAAPVVLGAEWLVGATTIPALEIAKQFRRVDSIVIGALLDEEDSGGPTTQNDLKSLNESMPPALVRRDGAFVWLDGEEAKATFHAIDGTPMEAIAFPAYDVMGLATATGAPNLQFNLAVGLTSTRRRGEPMSTEIIIELGGEDHEGQPLRMRHAVFHPQGQMPLTGFGIALVLEGLIGRGGQTPVAPGLYFPYQLLEPASYFERLEKMGGKVLKLEVL